MNTNNYESCSAIQNVTNERIYDRNIPSQNIQPYLDVRPVMTKYSIMPIVDPRKSSNEKIKQMPIFNTHQVFNPGNTKSPWSGYASQVDTETELRNQTYALQRCNQSSYMSNVNSDLYKYEMNTQPTNPRNNEFANLFKEEKFDSFNPNTFNIANSLFNNSTRQQIKDFSDNSEI
jgi:hypothetical protein